MACEAALVLFHQSFRCMWIFQSEELHYHRYKWREENRGRVHQHLNRKTVQIAWNVLKWMLTAKVMLDIIPSPQGRLLLTRSVRCCLQGDSFQMTELHPTQNSNSSLSSMFYLAWFTHRFCIIIYFNDRWVGVGCFACKTGKVELFSARKKSQLGSEMWCFNAKWATLVHRWPLFEGWQCTLYSNRCWYTITLSTYTSSHLSRAPGTVGAIWKLDSVIHYCCQ